MSNLPTTIETPLSTADTVDRFGRQDDFVPQEVIQETPVVVIGVGAIGREVCRMLACIGIKDITIVDFDIVTNTNITTQGFFHNDIGKNKVVAVEELIHSIDPEIKVTAIFDRFRPKMKLPDVVFMCVDSITARATIWKAVKKNCRLLIDGRMLGEVSRFITVWDMQSRDHFETTFFPENETYVGRCTGHATIYCASPAAALMVHQFTRFLRNIPLDNDMSLNLLAGDYFPVRS